MSAQIANLTELENALKELDPFYSYCSAAILANVSEALNASKTIESLIFFNNASFGQAAVDINSILLPQFYQALVDCLTLTTTTTTTCKLSLMSVL
jgi:arginine/ornithine N-succinyltransferase beta subunit